MTKFQLAKLTANRLYERLGSVRNASRLEFDWRMSQRLLEQFDEISKNESLDAVLCDEELCSEFSDMIVRTYIAQLEMMHRRQNDSK